MNEFTKEELLELKDGLSYLNGFSFSIYSKIQSMIDNYCEHEFSILPAPYFLMMCAKCDKTFVGDDFQS